MIHQIKLLVVTVAFLLVTFPIFGQGLGQYDQFGWTIIEPSEDSRIVYVSSSEGDDNNDGLSSSTARKTIAAGDELIRDGFPDQLLLKRGDVFRNETLRRWKSGRSANEPLVLSYYGETGERPLVIITDHFIRLAAQSRSHVAIVGLEFYKPNSDPDSDEFDNSACLPALSLSTGGEAENWLIEDCKFRYSTISIQGNVQDGLGFIHNVYVRRNIVLRGWAHGSTDDHLGRIQGMYVNEIENLFIEENFFDHNGWSATIPDANANQYNHNIYIQTTCYGTILVKGNVLMRGSAHGVQLRSGGTARHNAMINNAIGMNIGYHIYPEYNTEPTLVADNVVTDGRPQVPDDTSNPQTGAIWGLWKQLIDDATVNNNIVANMDDNRGGNLRPFNGFDNPNEFGDGNIAWNWERDDFPTEASHSDPSRNIASYATSKEWGGMDGYSQVHANRPLKTYTLEYSAYDYLNYIREGFGKSSDIVSDYTFTDGDVEIPTPLQVKDLDKILVYPNPVSDLLKIDQKIVGSHFRLYSVTGELQAKGTMTLSGIDFSSLSNGLYLLEINPSDQQVQVIQIIKSEK